MASNSPIRGRFIDLGNYLVARFRILLMRYDLLILAAIVFFGVAITIVARILAPTIITHDSQ